MSTKTHELSKRLPVRVSEKICAENPEFVNLLSTLSHKLSANGSSLHAHQRVQEREGELRAARLQWLHQHVLHHELHEMLTDQQLEAHQPSSFDKLVQSMVTGAEMVDYVECDPQPGGTRTLLGLTKEELQRRNPHQKYKQAVQQQLIPEIESRLRIKCERLVGFHDATSQSASRHQSDRESQLTFAKASQLPALLEAEYSRYQQEMLQLKDDENQRLALSRDYYNILLDSLATLEKMITQHRLQGQVDTDNTDTHWLAARCDALCLKLRLFELQLLCDTYHTGAVQALTQIRNEVDGAISETKRDLLQVTQALEAYESVGQGFDSLVKEYTRLRDEIENKKWALRELKQHQGD